MDPVLVRSSGGGGGRVRRAFRDQNLFCGSERLRRCRSKHILCAPRATSLTLLQEEVARPLGRTPDSICPS